MVRVEAASVTAGDARLRSGRFPRGFGLLARIGVGIYGPRRKIPGAVFSGRIERVGRGVPGVKVGDVVAGMTGTSLGAHAEYVTVPVSAICPLPSGISHADAAGTLFGGSTALYFLRDRAKIREGQTLLVNGASGSVGSAAVQLAANFGVHVTAVTRRPNHDLLRRIGASRTIDYRDTPITELRERFDVVFDTVGNLTRKNGLGLTNKDGLLVLAVASLADNVSARGRVIVGAAPERRADFIELLKLVSGGKFDPLVEVLGGLDSLPEAHGRIDSGRKVGNLVILPSIPGALPDTTSTRGDLA